MSAALESVMTLPLAHAGALERTAGPGLFLEEERSGWNHGLTALGRTLETADPHSLATSYLEQRGLFSVAVALAKSELLGNPLQWEPSDRALALWIAGSYLDLARIGTRIAERLVPLVSNDDVDGEAQLQECVASALVCRGHAQKWHAIAGETAHAVSLARIHGLFRTAERRGFARAQVQILHENVPHGMTVEGLYLRVLLLDFLFAGNLSRQQVEILDSWLWVWATDYRLTSQPEPGDLGLWIDVQAESGVRNSFMPPSGLDVRFVVAGHMDEQIEEVIGGFHAGHIFPGYGVSSRFRIEEHVAVIGYLKSTLTRMRRTGGAPRTAPRSAVMARVEGFVGLGDIQRRALRPDLDTSPDRQRRWFRIKDASEGGVRLVVEEKDWQPIEVGDLVAFAGIGQATMMIGEVVRKLPDAEPGCVQLGVSLLTRTPRPVTLAAAHRAVRATDIDAVYIPGADSCGRNDALLMSETSLSRFGERMLDTGNKSYQVAVNRVRRQGRGWALAGFEVVLVEAAA